MTVAFGLQSSLLTCPELKRLHLQWIQFTDLARYWLLQSCSQETIQQQLIGLRARIVELDQFMQLLLTPTIGLQNSESEQAHKPSDSSMIVRGKQEHDFQLTKQIKVNYAYTDISQLFLLYIYIYILRLAEIKHGASATTCKLNCKMGIIEGTIINYNKLTVFCFHCTHCDF